jgi:small-conductance mechanosensitive channel
MGKFNEFLDILKQIWYFDLLKLESMTIHVYHLFGLFLIFIVTRMIIKYSGKVVRLQIKTKNLDEGRTLALFKIVKYIIIVSAIMIGLDMVGIKLTLLIGGAAALLVGVGLGLQATFNDIFSGIIILFERSISVGDILEVDGIVGRVIDIKIRTSELATFDNISIILPNSRIVNNNIINWSHNRQLTRFTVTVGVSYGSDVELVRQLLQEVADENDDISNTRKPDIFFQDFGDSALIFDLKFWADPFLQIGKIRSGVRFAINAKFKEHNVSIPFPQRDIHIKSTVESTKA